MSYTKVYSQLFPGKFRNIKNWANFSLLLVYFGCSWIPWYREGLITNQALFIDLPKRRAYFFFIEIWPDEVYYITAILILAALGLFIFTSIFGRLWCGYTCPQTVFTDIFIYIETFFQGDRNARIKLDSELMSLNKFIRKFSTYGMWLITAFFFAYGWACYFYGARELTHDLLQAKVSENGTTWLLYLTATTYLFAGIMRDRVCTYFCPYGRFQSAMLDKYTSLVTYHDWRGEPRGHKYNRDKNSDNYDYKRGDHENTSDLVVKSQKTLIQDILDSQIIQQGDCIDCGKCVHSCPMGIDIRDGLQMKCIGCGLCIDACDSVMKKLNRPTGLIAYDSIVTSNMKKHGLFVKSWSNIFQTKVIAYGVIFIIAEAVLLYSFMHKSSYRILIDKERSPLFIHTADNRIRNIYNVNILNRTAKPQDLELLVQSDLQGLEFAIQKGMNSHYVNHEDIHFQQEEELSMRVIVQVPVQSKPIGSIPLYFQLREKQNNLSEEEAIQSEGNTVQKTLITKKTVFILP